MAYGAAGVFLVLALVTYSFRETAMASGFFVLAAALTLAGKVGWDVGYRQGHEDALDPTGKQRAALRAQQGAESLARLKRWSRERQEAKRAREAARKRRAP
jgi:hypothetical protein